MALALRRALAAAALVALAACGGGGSSPPPPPPPGWHTVDLKWSSNHEWGVNSAGGGYLVSIDGGTGIDVPYAGVPFDPVVMITASLYTGSHSFRVWAYSALDANGSTVGPGTTSAASTYSFYVP